MGERPAVERDAQLGVADGVAEALEGQQAALGVLPAQQGFAPEQAVRAGVDQGLELQFELVAGERAGEPGFERLDVEAVLAVEGAQVGAAACASDAARIDQGAARLAHALVELVRAVRGWRARGGVGVRGEHDRMQARPQPGCGDEVERAPGVVGQCEIQRAAVLAVDEQAAPGVEKVGLGGEEGGERTRHDVAVVAPEQTAGGAVGVDHELVAGDDQAFVDELEERKVDAGFGALGQVGHERCGRGLMRGHERAERT